MNVSNLRKQIFSCPGLFDTIIEELLVLLAVMLHIVWNYDSCDRLTNNIYFCYYLLLLVVWFSVLMCCCAGWRRQNDECNSWKDCPSEHHQNQFKWQVYVMRHCISVVWFCVNLTYLIALVLAIIIVIIMSRERSALQAWSWRNRRVCLGQTVNVQTAWLSSRGTQEDQSSGM